MTISLYFYSFERFVLAVFKYEEREPLGSKMEKAVKMMLPSFPA
jgi:hypothetical protein